MRDDERVARAAWSAVAEPGDAVAGALVGALGAIEAWRWVTGVADGGAPLVPSGAVGDVGRARLERSLRRWESRLPEVQPERDLDLLAGWGGALLVPGDAAWPEGLDALGTEAPHCLWVRGKIEPGAPRVSVVGARAATSYGERVAVDLAAGMAAAGVDVVSGGAYGIDAAAHRGALARDGRTVVVLAGGVDRAYPVGNARLFEAAVSGGGALVAEVPPGGLPTKSRFLQRNRLIAALSAATVVVEAAWRSGAMSTAHHAARLLRPVGAVPGPVTSAASAGCHRLLRDGVAVCVTDADEVLELAGPLVLTRTAPQDESPGQALDTIERRVLDALPTKRGSTPDRVSVAAGVTLTEALEALGILELAGLAGRVDGGWARTHLDMRKAVGEKNGHSPSRPS